MDEKPLSIWNRPWRGRGKALAWFGLAGFATSLTISCISLLLNWKASIPEFIFSVAFCSVLLTALLFVGFVCVRWLVRWRNLRRLLFGFACLATLLALAFAEENWRGKHAWDKYRREWEAKGEKFDLTAVTPAPVPDEKNFALTPLLKPVLDYTNGPEGVVWRDTNGLARLETVSPYLGSKPETKDPVLGSLEKGTFADLRSWAEFFHGNTNYPQAGASATPAETLLAAFGRLEPELMELRGAAASRPECRFPVQYGAEPSWSILLPHLGRMKGLTTLTDLHALAKLETGRPAEAFEDLKLGLRLSSTTRDEPFLISHMVRVASLSINLQTLREGLVRHAWSEAQLAELESYLAGVNVLAEYEFAMRGERACSVVGLDYLRRQGFRGDALNYIGDENGGAASAPPLNALPGGWICQNMLAICRTHQDYLLPVVDERAHRAFPEVNASGKRAVARMRTGPYTIFAKMLLPALETAVRKSARMQTYVDEAQVACALERYRLVNGKLPDSLEALTPRFIAAIPNDVIDGKPLRYRPNSDRGYVLYSIGWNQTDDRGEIAIVPQKQGENVDLTQGDWVWKMPSSNPSVH